MISRLAAVLLVAFCFATNASATNCWKNAPCSGTIHGVPKTGTLDILSIFVDVNLGLCANVKIRLGALVHTLVWPLNVKGTENTLGRWNPTCNILNLRLLAVDLDLLGIHLDEILVNVSVAEYGELSGLLCQLGTKPIEHQYAVLNSCVSQYAAYELLKLNLCLKLNLGGLLGSVLGAIGH